MFAHGQLACASRRWGERLVHRPRSDDKRICGLARWLVAVAIVAGSPHAAQAHGIVGNRVFPGTLTFEDPAVMDELVLPAMTLKHPAEGADRTTASAGRSRGS
jgi:hypothetical protein